MVHPPHEIHLPLQYGAAPTEVLEAAVGARSAQVNVPDHGPNEAMNRRKDGATGEPRVGGIRSTGLDNSDRGKCQRVSSLLDGRRVQSSFRVTPVSSCVGAGAQRVGVGRAAVRACLVGLDSFPSITCYYRKMVAAAAAATTGRPRKVEPE